MKYNCDTVHQGFHFTFCIVMSKVSLFSSIHLCNQHIYDFFFFIIRGYPRSQRLQTFPITYTFHRDKAHLSVINLKHLSYEDINGMHECQTVLGAISKYERIAVNLCIFSLDINLESASHVCFAGLESLTFALRSHNVEILS